MIGSKKENISDYAYFITTKVAKGLPLFVYDDYCRIIIEALNFYRRVKSFRLLGYVIMPNHLHLIIWPFGKYSVQEILRDFKKQTAKDIIRRLKMDKRCQVGITNPNSLSGPGLIILDSTGLIPPDSTGLINKPARTAAADFLRKFFKNSAKQEFKIWQSSNWVVNIYSGYFF